MYLPEPVFGLVLAYVTDGWPVRRIISEWRPERGGGERGWERVGTDRGALERLRAPGRDWGDIKRLIDAHAYLIHTSQITRNMILYCRTRQAFDIVQCLRPWNRPAGDLCHAYFSISPFDPWPDYEYPRMHGESVSFWLLESMHPIGEAVVDSDDYIVFMMRECLAAGGALLPDWCTRANVFIL
jgi:hypothetical protein